MRMIKCGWKIANDTMQEIIKVHYADDKIPISEEKLTYDVS